MPAQRPQSSPWLKLQPSGGRRPQLRVVCFPPAGGGSASFAPLLPAAGRWVECHTVELPGRASRIADAPASSLLDAARDIADAVVEQIVPGRLPYVLLGQCMGGVLAYEVAARLDTIGARPPARIVVAGTNGPERAAPDVDDPLAFLRRSGGVPEELFDQPEFLAMTLAVLSADLAMVRDYRPKGQVVAAPITVLAGKNDTMVDEAGLRCWDGLSAAGVSYEQLPGGHFFLDEHYAALVMRLRRELRPQR